MGDVSNAIDPQRLRRDYSVDASHPQPHPAGPRDIDPNALTSARLDYGQLAANLGTTSIAQVSSIVSPIVAAQAQLDAYRAAFTASYNVGGTNVRVPCQFRMVGGHNDTNAGYGPGRVFDAHKSPVRELLAICATAHATGAMHCLMGCPTASEIAHVTQALIDAGKLPSGPASLESKIKTMQWQFGIGIDCTDYVLGAALRASGKSSSDVVFSLVGVPSPGTDYFQRVESNPHLRSASFLSARTGDVFVLDDPTDVGHRAVVYSHTVSDASKLASLASQFGPRITAFASGGPVHVLEVDASWSAGRFGGDYGGVRRDTWLYNESTQQWAQINQRVNPPTRPTFDYTPAGPANELLHGVYRFQ